MKIVKRRIGTCLSRLRTLSLETTAKAVFALMLLLALFSTLYSIIVYKANPPMAFLQFIQTVTLIVQAAILFIQTVILSRQLGLYRHHEIPVIVLKHSGTKYGGTESKPVAIATINVRNLTDNPAFYVKLWRIDAKIGKRIGDEILKNVDCDIVEYLGPREEREMCRIFDPQRFAEVVDLVKISYWDAYGDWRETVFWVSSERGRLVFTPIPQNILKQRRREEEL